MKKQSMCQFQCATHMRSSEQGSKPYRYRQRQRSVLVFVRSIDTPVTVDDVPRATRVRRASVDLSSQSGFKR